MGVSGKKLLKGILFLIGFVIFSAIVIASVFEEKIGNLILKEANNQIKSELTVSDFNLSLISSFPKASVNLKEVMLEDAFGDVLVEANEVAFKFGLFSLFGSNMKVHSVEIREGSLSVKFDKRGKGNFDIAKESEGETSGSVGISLEEAKLENVELIYEDQQLEQTILVLINEMELSGEFSSEKFELESYADMKSHFIEMGETRYLVGKDLGYDAKIFVNHENGMNEFEKVKLIIEDNIFNVNGFVTSFKDATDFDLVLEGDDTNLESLVQLLPAQYIKEYGDFRTKGNFNIQTKINGELSAKSNPKVDVKMDFEDGSISSKRMDGSLKDVSFNAIFTNGKEQDNSSSIFKLENFKGYFNRELFELDFTLFNLDDPIIDMDLDGAIALETIYGLFDNPAITDGTGEIEFKNLHLKGKFKDMMTPSRVARVDLTGEIEFDDAGLTINDEDLVFDKGKLLLKDNYLGIEDFEIDGAGSEIQLSGFIKEFLPVVLADSLNTQNAKLTFDTKLTASKLDLARLIKIGDIQVTEDEVGKENYDSMLVAKGVERERLTNFLRGTFDARIDNFTYNKIEGRDFVGKIKFDNGAMKIAGQTDAMEGFFDLEGTMFFEKEPRLKATLESIEINVTDFFEQCENFGQENLVADNVSGSMNAKFVVSAKWDEEGNFLDNDLRVLAGVGIHDGELKDFKLLEEFSDYVNVRDLRHIRFVNMQNFFEIRKRKLYIPTMFLQNNAMNLTLSGTQSFEEEIDYNLQVNAGQVLMTKFKNGNGKLEPIKAKKRGLFNLYFNIYGTLDKFDYKTNKNKVKKAFRLSEHRKNEIKAAIIKAFGKIDLLDEDEKPIPEIPEFDDGDDDDEYIDW